MHWTLARDVEELAASNKVHWNRMAVTAIEIGLELFDRISRRSPSLARDLLRIRRGPIKGAHAYMLEQELQKAETKVRYDDHISAAIRAPIKARMRQTKKRTGLSMAAQLRGKLEG